VHVLGLLDRLAELAVPALLVTRLVVDAGDAPYPADIGVGRGVVAVGVGDVALRVVRVADVDQAIAVVEVFDCLAVQAQVRGDLVAQVAGEVVAVFDETGVGVVDGGAK
jgi:hypothetical protein